MDDFAAYMDCTTYRKKSDVERFVIVPAIKDINNCADDLSVSYEIEKKAPKCYSLHFHVLRQDVFNFALGLLDGSDCEELKADSVKKAEAYVKTQIEYNELYSELNVLQVNLLDVSVQVMVNIYCAEPSEKIKINRTTMSIGAIQKRYHSLNKTHILSVIHKASENKDSIKILLPYMQTLLFNEPLVGSILPYETEKKDIERRPLDEDEKAAIRRMLSEPTDPQCAEGA